MRPKAAISKREPKHTERAQVWIFVVPLCKPIWWARASEIQSDCVRICRKFRWYLTRIEIERKLCVNEEIPTHPHTQQTESFDELCFVGFFLLFVRPQLRKPRSVVQIALALSSLSVFVSLCYQFAAYVWLIAASEQQKRKEEKHTHSTHNFVYWFYLHAQ